MGADDLITNSNLQQLSRTTMGIIMLTLIPMHAIHIMELAAFLPQCLMGLILLKVEAIHNLCILSI